MSAPPNVDVGKRVELEIDDDHKVPWCHKDQEQSWSRRCRRMLRMLVLSDVDVEK